MRLFVSVAFRRAAVERLPFGRLAAPYAWAQATAEGTERKESETGLPMIYSVPEVICLIVSGRYKAGLIRVRGVPERLMLSMCECVVGGGG